jgi:hypothetical protein
MLQVDFSWAASDQFAAPVVARYWHTIFCCLFHRRFAFGIVALLIHACCLPNLT